jgi:hypothetical protein
MVKATESAESRESATQAGQVEVHGKPGNVRTCGKKWMRLNM